MLQPKLHDEEPLERARDKEDREDEDQRNE
jgi:hypothetical protein